MRVGIEAARAAALLAAVWLCSPSSAPAQPAVPNPHEMTIVVGTPAGGGYDAYARLVARHLGEMMPERPGVVVENMPGAGSLVAANWLANSAPRDGSTIAILPSGTIFEQLLGNRNARFDATKFEIIGSLNKSDPVVIVWRSAPFTTAQDLFEKSALVGASGAGSNDSVMPNILNTLVHTKFNVVNGYSGEAGVELAMENGEVQAEVGADWDFIKALKPEWVQDHKIRVLMQASLNKSSDLPDVPTVMTFVSDKNKAALQLLLARQTYGVLFLAPPGSSSKAVAEVRRAFDRMTRGPAFIADAQKTRLTLNPTRYQEVSKTLDSFLSSPQPVIAQAAAVLRRFEPQ